MEPPQQGQRSQLVDNLVDILRYIATVEYKGLGRWNLIGVLLIVIVVILTGAAVVALDAVSELDLKAWHFVVVLILVVAAWLACVWLMWQGMKTGTRLWDE